jgi:superfamily II DNA/RNA helicase
MFQKSSPSKGRSFSGRSRPSFGRSGGERNKFRSSSGGSSFPRRNFGGRSRSRFADRKIDVSRYVNKSVAPKVPLVVYEIKHAFADFIMEEPLKNNIIQKGYTTPTPIQDRAIPEILNGRDVVGIANTGTGKTAAFLIPLINKVLKNKKEQVLVVVPTRELALQIQDELKGFTRQLSIFSACLVGGAPIGKQIAQLRYFNNFIIGTPGRIKDLLDRKSLDLSKFKTVVLDEADRMLDMGFINDMRFLMEKMEKDRHTLFFSATLSPEVEKLIHDFLNEPVRISVKTQDTAKNVEQDIVKITNGQNKLDVLHDLLTKKDFEKVLIFGKTKHGVERLSNDLEKRGIKSASIHGDKRQSQRQRALSDFKTNRAQVLVATDVAARGLDIPDVTHVINFDIPATHEDYIHRIGRTGRGDKKGKALTFVE